MTEDESGAFLSLGGATAAEVELEGTGGTTDESTLAGGGSHDLETVDVTLTGRPTVVQEFCNPKIEPDVYLGGSSSLSTRGNAGV